MRLKQCDLPIDATAIDWMNAITNISVTQFLVHGERLGIEILAIRL